MTLRVTSGRPAYLEGGEIVQALSRLQIYDHAVRGHGIGLAQREVALTRGFVVTVAPRGAGNVEVQIQPFASLQGQAGHGERELRELQTTLRTPLGRWTLVGGSSAGGDSDGQTYSTRSSLAQTSTLMKIDPAGP